MLTKKTRKHAVQEDIKAIDDIQFSPESNKSYDSNFDSIVRKILLITWLPSMLPLALWYMTHMEVVKISAESVLRTCLGLGIMNALFSLVLVVSMFKSIDTYLNFKCHIKNALKLGLSVDNLIKNTAQFMCVSSVIISLGVAFSSEPSLIGWAWPVAFFPSLLVAKVLHGVDKRRLGLTKLIRKIKRRIHDEEKRTWLKLWPNVM